MRVGILGGGQLGQMMILAGYPIGIETSAFEQSDHVPAAIVGDVCVGDVTDRDKLHKWASQLDVITYEFENFPAPIVADLAEVRPVHPNPGVLATAQDRWHEKKLFNEIDIPVAPFRTASTDDEIRSAITELRGPYVVKTRTGGYDGKGQVVLNEGDSLEPALELLKMSEVIVEEKLLLDKEISIIGVRAIDGSTVTYPVVENEHRNNILHKSTVPAGVSKDLAEQARQHITDLMKRLDYVGVLTLEMFVVGGRIIANEIAPRVHNSGHWTIEGSETSQFENHLRAVAGLPLGGTDSLCPTAMVNLVGTTPDSKAIMRIAGAHLHLYGKDARPGRKIGHVTVTAPNKEVLTQRVNAVENVVNNVLS